jgi:hypothetical protein
MGRPRVTTSRAASSTVRTPARQAALISPTLWPIPKLPVPLCSGFFPTRKTRRTMPAAPGWCARARCRRQYRCQQVRPHEGARRQRRIQVLAVYAVGFVKWARHAAYCVPWPEKSSPTLAGVGAAAGGRKVGMGASEELLQPVNQTVAVTYQGNAVPMGSLDDVGRPHRAPTRSAARSAACGPSTRR